jgi:hypothetical protein
MVQEELDVSAENSNSSCSGTPVEATSLGYIKNTMQPIKLIEDHLLLFDDFNYLTKISGEKN